MPDPDTYSGRHDPVCAMLRRRSLLACRRSLKSRPVSLLEDRPPSHDRMGDHSAGLGADQYFHGSEGISIRAIAARLGLSRDTVSRAVKSSSPPKYVRVSGPSARSAPHRRLS